MLLIAFWGHLKLCAATECSRLGHVKTSKLRLKTLNEGYTVCLLLTYLNCLNAVVVHNEAD